MPDYTDIQSIRNFKSLVKYLRKHLDWPIDEEHADDLTYDCTPAELGRVLFTQDKGLSAEAARCQRAGAPFGGLIYSPAVRTYIGAAVSDLRTIAEAGEPSE